MMLTKQRKILIICGVIFLVFVLGLAFAKHKKTENQGATSEAISGVILDNFDNYKTKLKSLAIGDAIQEQLYDKLFHDEQSVDRGYGATIRDNSLQVGKLQTGEPTYDFLVDIPSLKRTYTVSITGDDDNPSSRILIVDCPNAQQLKYPAKPCASSQE